MLNADHNTDTITFSSFICLCFSNLMEFLLCLLDSSVSRADRGIDGCAVGESHMARMEISLQIRHVKSGK